VRVNYGNEVRSHGKEWKQTFRKISFPFLEKNIFPDDLSVAIKRYFVKTPYTQTPELLVVLKRYDV
jgi:hypothetical protein